MRINTLLLFSSALFATVSHADHDQGFFAGASVAYISNESFVPANNEKDRINFPAAELVGGYKYNPWLGVDVRIGVGGSSQDLQGTVDDNEVGYEYSIDGYQSIYYRPELTNKEAKIYALLGYSTLDITTEIIQGDNVTEVSFSESSASYGLGVGWFVDENININVEFRMLLDKDEDEFVNLTFGLDYRF